MKSPRAWPLLLVSAVMACGGDDPTGPALGKNALLSIPPTDNSACNVRWASGTNGSWFDANKWNPAVVPTSTSSVCIDAAGTYTVTLDPPVDATPVGILALTVGGPGATPTLRLGGADATMNVTEGILIQANAEVEINTGTAGIINAAGTITNSGILEGVAPCGGCGTAHAINGDIINNGTINVSSALLTLGKVGGAYQNNGIINILQSLLIPSAAGSATFSQDAGVITGSGNFNTFKIRSGTVTLNGGKVRTRSPFNDKPILIVQGANLVFNPTFSDSGSVGVWASPTTPASITGNIPALTVLWLSAETGTPGTITFADATQTNNGTIRLHELDGSDNVNVTLGGTGRLTNAGAITSGSSFIHTFHFALELTNNGSLTVGEDIIFEKAGGTYYNAGTISGVATLHVKGTTLVSTSTGTVTPTGSGASPNFQVDGGRVMGTGTVGDVTLVNGGTVEPGTSAGMLIANSITVNTGTSLRIELGGTQVGTQYDQLSQLNGAPNTPGAMDVSEINGFLSGICGQAFDVLPHASTAGGYTGFGTYNGLNPAANRALRVFNKLTVPRMITLYGYDPTVKISVAPNPVAIAEGGAGVQYAVCLDGVPALTGGQTVTVTPTPNAQVTISPPSLTFNSSNWQAPQFFTVTAVDDNVVEGNHSGSVTHASSSAVAPYNGVTIASLTANITDNDAPPQSATTTSVGSSANPSTFGQSVTFTATVTSSGGTPAGTVQFNIDGSDFGSPVALDVGGQATIAHPSLAVGNHPVTATYSGNSSFTGSNGALSGGQVVSPAATSTAVSSSANPSTFGQSVTFTATVTSGIGTPTGMVTFNIDGVDGSPIALNASGQAMFTTSALSVGNHPVTATYAGGGNFGSSGGALSGGQNVNAFVPTSTTTSVSSSVNPSTVGQAVTFTATVSSGAGTPTGTVQFFIDGSPASGAVALSSGQATFMTSALAQGTHPVSATYTPSGGFEGSSGALSGGQTVNYNATTTGVSSSQNPSTFGQSVTFTATVSSSAGTPGGSVQFGIDGNPVGAPVALVSGQATLAISTLSAGTHGVSATYLGNATYATSGGSLGGGQGVNQANTSTGVTSSANPSLTGQNVTFTATVSSGAGVPSGTVQFNIDGSDVGAPVALNASGQATFATSSLGAGNHPVTATYAGSTNFAGSSGALSGGQQVNAPPPTPAATTTVVTSSANPSIVGQQVTFTATVSSGAGTPGGTVQFSIDGSPVGSPVALSGGQATYATSSLTAGNHGVAAAYSGSATYQSSNGSLSGGQNVNPAPTGTGVGQAGIDIDEVVIIEAFKSGPDMNEARGTFTIRNSSSGPATVATLGTVTVKFRSNRAAGQKTDHAATCTFAPVVPTADVLAPQEAKVYAFDCNEFTPSLLSSAATLTATVTVVNVSNQLGQTRIRTWTKNSAPFALP